MHRRELIVALGVAGSSGCLRLSGSDSATTPGSATATATRTGTRETPTTSDDPTETSTAEPTETATAEPTETATPEPTLPDGLSDDGVEDYLYDVHLRELGRRSFATDWTLFNFVEWSPRPQGATQGAERVSSAVGRGGNDSPNY